MAIALQQPQEGVTWEEWSNFGYPRTGHTVCRGSCRCTLAPMMYIEFSMELAEPGGLIVSDVGPTEKQQEIIKLIEQWERAGKDPGALELIGKTDDEMLEYLRETVAPDKTQYLNALHESTHNTDFSSYVGARDRAEALHESISQTLKDIGISLEDEAPNVGTLTIMKKTGVGGRYYFNNSELSMDRDLWNKIGIYLERGQKLNAVELREVKDGIKTLLHEYTHSLTDLTHLGKSEVAHNVEEALTEYIAHKKINMFIKQLGLDSINKNILDIEIKRTYAAQTGSLGRLLEYVSPSQEGRTQLAINMHRIADKGLRADYYMDALERSKNIKFTIAQRNEFRDNFGNWSGAGYRERIEGIMRVIFGL